MPSAEPALSLAPLPLSAVVGAAITTGITTPVTPGGPPPQCGGHGLGALGAGGCAGTTTLRLPRGKPGADLALRHAHCHDATHGQRFAHARPGGEEWRRGGRPYGLRDSLPPARGGASTISFGFRLLVAATLARGGWLDPLRAHKDLHLVRSTKLAWRTNAGAKPPACCAKSRSGQGTAVLPLHYWPDATDEHDTSRRIYFAHPSL